MVAYRDAFINQWAEFEQCFHIWNNGDVDATRPPHPPCNPLPLILVTHDELTFYQNDERKTCWGHQHSRPAPQPKGEGQSLMVSDFLTAEWGCLRTSDRCIILYFLSSSLSLSNCCTAGRLALYSNLERTAMGTSLRRSS